MPTAGDLVHFVDDVLASEFRLTTKKTSTGTRVAGGSPIQGWGSPVALNLINALCSRPGSRYVEFGTFQGLSLVAAAHGNPHCECIGVDKFVTDPPYDVPDSAGAAARSIAPYPNARLVVADFTSLPHEVIGRRPFTVAYLDADHSVDGTLLAMHMVKPLLSHPAVLILDDYRNNPTVGVKEAVKRGRALYTVHREWVLPGHAVWVAVVG